MLSIFPYSKYIPSSKYISLFYMPLYIYFCITSLKNISLFVHLSLEISRCFHTWISLPLYPSLSFRIPVPLTFSSSAYLFLPLSSIAYSFHASLQFHNDQETSGLFAISTTLSPIAHAFLMPLSCNRTFQRCLIVRGAVLGRGGRTREGRWLAQQEL